MEKSEICSKTAKCNQYLLIKFEFWEMEPINHRQYMEEYIKLEKGQEWSAKKEDKWIRDESVAKLKQKAV